MIGDELTGEALDRAVAEALGYEFAETPGASGVDPDGDGEAGRENSLRWYRAPGQAKWTCALCCLVPDAYSTEWEHGGPLIERFNISLSPPTERVHRNGGPSAGWGELGVWMATTWRPRKGDGHRPIGSGDTPLQAAMRCIVDLHSAGAPR